MASRTGTAVLASAECLLRLARVLHTERERDVAAAGCEHVFGGDVHLGLGELRRDTRESPGLVREAHFDRLALRRAEAGLLERATRLRRVLVLDHEADGSLALAGRGSGSPQVHTAIRERLRGRRERARSVLEGHD